MADAPPTDPTSRKKTSLLRLRHEPLGV